MKLLETSKGVTHNLVNDSCAILYEQIFSNCKQIKVNMDLFEDHIHLNILLQLLPKDCLTTPGLSEIQFDN